VLIDALDRRGRLHRTFDDAGLVLSGARRAEADLVSWLERPGELGCVPDEVEHIWTRPVPIDGVAEARWPAMYLFRFRVTKEKYCMCGLMRLSDIYLLRKHYYQMIGKVIGKIRIRN
jgi:hypothetical protein